jgi:hypothetical protein
MSMIRLHWCLSLAGAALLGCAADPIESSSEEPSSPADTTPLASAKRAPPTAGDGTAVFSIAGQQFEMPAVFDLQANADGRITLNAGSMQATRAIGLRVVLPASSAKATGSRIAFRGGVGQDAQLNIVEGTLPDLKWLMAIDGTLTIARLSEKSVLLDFDVGLSARPDGSTGRVPSQGSLSGSMRIACMKYAVPDSNARIEGTEGGEGRLIVSDDARTSPQCQDMLKLLDPS